MKSLRIANWDGSATRSVETSFVEVTRDMLMRNLLDPYLSAQRTNISGAEASCSSVYCETALKMAAADYHDYDELLIASGDQATKLLEAKTHSKDISAWQFGKLNALTMNHPLGHRESCIACSALAPSSNREAPTPPRP